VVVAHDREKFNCQACRWHKHCDETNPAPFPMFAIPEIGLESRTCLLPMVDEGSRELLRLYGHYKNGLLPFGGGILEQPALYDEAMAYIDAQVTRLKAEGG
jgi:hypothetical protein